MTFEWFDSAAAATMAAFVNGVWIGALLAGVAWAGIRLFSSYKPLNATTRFAVWGMVFLMCTGLIVWQGGRHSADRSASVSEAAPVAKPEPVPAAALESAATPTPAQKAASVAPVAVAEPAVVQSVAPVTGEDREVEPYEIEAGFLLPLFEITIPEKIELPAFNGYIRLMLFTIWGTVSGMLLLRVFWGWCAVRRMKENASPAPERIRAALKKALRQIDRPRAVGVAITEEVQTAAAIGFWRPQILIPAHMTGTLSQVELEQVLLHEAAHIQRWDDWTMLAQRIVTALLFFHPGILLLGKLMDRDREFACDDWVVALTKRPKAYASCLAKLVALHMRPHPAGFVPGFSSGKEQLFDRVKTILDKKRTISFKYARARFFSIMLVTAFLLVMMVKIAPVVAVPAEANLSLEIAEATPFVPAQPQEETVEPVDEAPPVIESPIQEAPAPTEQQPIQPILAGEPDEPQGNGLQIEGTFENITAFDFERIGTTDVGVVPLPQPAAAKPSAPPARQVVSDDDPLSKASRIRLLRSIRRIPSSGDKAQLLIQAAEKMQFDAEVFTAFLESARSVQSSGDKTRALLALVKHQDLDEGSAVSFLKAASQIPSSGEKTRVLLNSMDRLPLAAEAVTDAYLDVIEGIHSSSEYRRVMNALLERTRNSG